MKIILSYEYSTLDGCHTFGLVFEGIPNSEIWVRWVWFHLGGALSGHGFGPEENRMWLYPFKVGKVIACYSDTGSARKKAGFIARKIIKKIEP